MAPWRSLLALWLFSFFSSCVVLALLLFFLFLCRKIQVLDYFSFFSSFSACFLWLAGVRGGLVAGVRRGGGGRGEGTTPPLPRPHPNQPGLALGEHGPRMGEDRRLLGEDVNWATPR